MGQYLQGDLKIFMYNLGARCLSAWRYCHEAKVGGGERLPEIKKKKIKQFCGQAS